MTLSSQEIESPVNPGRFSVHLGPEYAIGQVTLDPATHECQINYRIGINLGDKMASPREVEPIPVLRFVRYFMLSINKIKGSSSLDSVTETPGSAPTSGFPENIRR